MSFHSPTIDWLLVGVVPGLLIVLFWIGKIVVTRWVTRMDEIDRRLRRQESLYHEIKAEQMMDRYWRETVGGDFPKPNPDVPRKGIPRPDEPSGGA